MALEEEFDVELPDEVHTFGRWWNRFLINQF